MALTTLLISAYWTNANGNWCWDCVCRLISNSYSNKTTFSTVVFSNRKNTYDNITICWIGFTQFIIGDFRLKISDIERSCSFERILIIIGICTYWSFDQITIVIVWRKSQFEKFENWLGRRFTNDGSIVGFSFYSNIVYHFIRAEFHGFIDIGWFSKG